MQDPDIARALRLRRLAHYKKFHSEDKIYKLYTQSKTNFEAIKP